MADNYFISMILYLIITTGVIFIAYYTTVWLAKKMNCLAKNRHSSVLEKVVVASNISIYTIKVGLMVYIIASNGKSIEQLDKMTFKEWTETSDHSTGHIHNKEHDKHDGISWIAFGKKWRNSKSKGKEKN
ncbi:hypothetical protein [Tindallia californiensis]|uniref:Flagellar protein FliO/FliZ n=1 Tax=Tindallia californiensis TaxID=159292 RepID=A0A1H3NSJ5_9FIRM|nr:hypothetical protein [Tindallia californiensis]SDY91405.1 flagellar protein FliO/FliZ [Tindallia californiensis]